MFSGQKNCAGEVIEAMRSPATPEGADPINHQQATHPLRERGSARRIIVLASPSCLAAPAPDPRRRCGVGHGRSQTITSKEPHVEAQEPQAEEPSQQGRREVREPRRVSPGQP
jgi:hypothetical protein